MSLARKKVIVAAALVVVIAASGVWVWHVLASWRPAAENPPLEWECGHCGSIFEARMPAEYLRSGGEAGTALGLPRCNCPQCGSPAHLRTVMKCLGCGTVFVFSQAYLEPSGAGRAAGSDPVVLRCIHPGCEELLPRQIVKKPRGRWKRFKCAACGKRFDVLLAGSAAPASYRCLDARCGSDRVDPVP